MNNPIAVFQSGLMAPQNQHNLEALLPSWVSVDKFNSVVMTAVQQDPEVLNSDRTSLFLACRDAASDGLLPDKKQGALVTFNTKGRDGQWQKKVQWLPMVAGVRQLLSRAGFSIRAEIVYANDKFRYVQGDNPSIEHEGVVFGDRGEPVGVYAIATYRETGEMFRDAMDWSEILYIKGISRSGDKGPWGKFESQMARKTIIHRLAKQLPLTDPTYVDSEELQERVVRVVEQPEKECDLEGEHTLEAPPTAGEQVQAAIQEQIESEEPAF